MGVGSKGKPTYVSGRVLKSVEKLGKRFGLDDEGRLGQIKPKSGSRKNEQITQHVYSANPKATAKKFWDVLQQKADELRPVRDVPGAAVAKFGNKTFVTYRPNSSSDGSPAITINDNSSTGFIYKIHFLSMKGR